MEERESLSRYHFRLPDSLPTGDDNLTSVLIIVGWNQETRRREIVLTKRTVHVETHKGQVSFPGGFWEPTDQDLLHTALRESEEEIGTKAEHLTIIGGMAPVQTRGGVLIYPWIAEMELPYLFNPNAGEVERLLFLPLKVLLEEGLKTVTVEVEGFRIKSPGIIVDNELVWGATAKMLDQFRAQVLSSLPTK